jgi:glycyl-tRNA synthetase beta chain
MPTLLYEIGTEELPAGFVAPAVRYLKEASAQALSEARLSHGEIRAEGTPRRLVLMVDGLAAAQETVEEEVTGPRVDIAWDGEGNLTKAGQGFLRGRGLDESAAYKKETKKGEVIAAMVREEGKPAQDVLPALLEELTAKVPFKKNMRWTDGKETFGRPVRWLLALLDKDVVPLSFADVTSSNETRGHRFHAPDPVVVDGVDAYLKALESGRVTLDVEARKRVILERARALANEAGGALLEDDALLDIVANLVETPWPILGRFEERFLEMPKELLLSEMREHQKYFGVVDKSGALLPCFIIVAGSEPKDPDDVAAGNARVLRSRFEDGAFYFREDQKVPLKDRVTDLERVLFQRDLGTVREKTARIEALTSALAKATGADDKTTAAAERAALLCKADLVTGVVGEFPELQGTMGRTYAERDGEGADVAQAIEDHYAPRGHGGALPESEAGALVALADRLDTLVGILGIGKAPSGSADPFGLRRAAIAFLTIAMSRGYRFSLSAKIERAVDLLGDKKSVEREALIEQVTTFFKTRLKAVLVERAEAAGIEGAGDIVDAAIGAGFDDLADLEARTIALAKMRAQDHDGFLSLAAAFKRVGNILNKARGDDMAVAPDALDESKLSEDAEKALLSATTDAQKQFDAAHDKGGDAGAKDLAVYEVSLETIAGLKPAVDRFFDDVLVMADDTAVRDARLALLARIERMLTTVADFTRVQVES